VLTDDLTTVWETMRPREPGPIVVVADERQRNLAPLDGSESDSRRSR